MSAFCCRFRRSSRRLAFLVAGFRFLVRLVLLAGERFERVPPRVGLLVVRRRLLDRAFAERVFWLFLAGALFFLVILLKFLAGL